MAYFVFNPQTNELDSSDNPTPIRKNLGQKLLTKQIPQYGSPDTYGESFFEEDMPNMPDLLREEGIKIGEQVKNNNGERVGFKRGKSEALLIRNKAANALKKVIDAGDFLEFRKLAEEIDVPATTLRRVYNELFAGQGVIKKTRDANKIIDKIIQTGETNSDKIKKIAKETYKVNIGDRAIKTATNMATDLSLAEYEDIFRKMAADRTYEPPIDISAKGKGLTANYIKAKANVKNEIPNLQTLLNQNISKRKKIKEMKKIADDPDLKTKYLVKKQMIRDKKRFLEAGKIGLSKADLALNSNQRTLIKKANELINSNPDALLKDKNLLNKISWRVDGKGNLYQSKPDLSAVLNPKSDSRFFHLSHSRRAGLGTQLTDAPVNRFATTFNFNNEFIKDAENFIEKNPDHPNVTKILKKAKELKITLRPNVPLGTFKNASGNSVRYVGYTQNINKPIEKIKTVIDEFMPKSLLKEWKPVVKKTVKNVAGKFIYPAMVANQMAFGDKYETWDGPGIFSDFPLTPGKDVEQTNELLGMIGDKLNMAEGGSVEPRIPYRDGSMLGDSRGWEKMLDKTDPNVLAMIAARKAEADRKDFEDRQQANAEGYKHKSEYKDDKPFGIIPAYQADVMKKSFGTKEGLKMTAGALGKGVVETAEWMVEIVPHVFKELHKKGMMPYQSKEDMEKYLKDNNNQMNWMDLLSSDLSWGDKTGLTKMSDDGLKGLTERFGKGNVPKGVKSVQFGSELAGMIADPFVLYAALPRAAKAATAAKFKAFKEAKNADQVDLAKRDFMKVLGVGGVMAAMGKLVPDLFAGKKIKDAAQAAKVVKTLDGIQGGMPEFIPQFLYKVMKGKGTLKSLPDRNFVEGASYQVMLPVKRKYYTSTNKDRGIHTDPDGNPITSRGKKDYWGAKGGHTETRIEKVPVNIEVMNDGGFHISWKGTDNFGDDIDRSMYYRPGETGTQNYAADEFGQGISKEEVVITDPEFSYTEPDFSSTTPDSPRPDSELFLDPANDADEIVEAMKSMLKT